MEMFAKELGYNENMMAMSFVNREKEEIRVP